MKKIALTEEEFAIVTHIMKNYPHTAVFGSRAKGTNKKFSDLDLCIKDQITGYEYELLKEAFEQSNLPFTVDLVLYSRCDDSFKKIIDREGVRLTAD
jgi:uncharacterized protein